MARAKSEEKLILLSIGYSACHWCHVMERESFENESIAALMNEHFVNIKVDREERPDLDEIYMAATIAMNQGQGGWPMTVFLTPELEPVFAGTYFPPDDLHGRPGFPRVLTQVAQYWKDSKEDVQTRAKGFADELSRVRKPPPSLAIDEKVLDLAVSQYREDFDTTWGGFGSAPKFPPSVGLMFLLRQYAKTNDDHILLMVSATLDAMANGGLYDHIGGGFARYSTDREWLAPHFEKMLYDNALLSRAYLEAYQVTKSQEYKSVVVETLDYILREMTAPEGGLYSATDADSEGEEGKFFVWHPKEVIETVQGDADFVCAYYDISEGGNWEGKSIPRTRQPLESVAREHNIPLDDARERIARAKQKLYDVRLQRVPPGLDDKILTSWNGLMIAALADGYRILRDPRYLEAARRAADFVKEALTKDGRLLRAYRNGEAHIDAYLEDYAYLSEGLMHLYEASGERKYLDWCVELVGVVLDRFSDEMSEAFYHTSSEHTNLLFRFQEGTDSATPAPNGVMAYVLFRLAAHLGRDDWRKRGLAAVSAYGAMIERFPRAFAQTLIALDYALHDPIEIVVTGREGVRGDIEEAIATSFAPYSVRVLGADTPSDLPLLEGRHTTEATLYLCRGGTCELPITDPLEAESALAASHAAVDR